MELALAVTALVVITLVFAIASIRSRAAVKAAREDHRLIYKSCFLRGLAGILAKMTTADGAATLDEVNVVGRLFNDMGLDADDRELCFEAFRTAKSSNLPMNYYASLFAPYSTKESRKVVYEVLWDITAADGQFDPQEERFLRDLVKWLDLEESEYEVNRGRTASRFREDGAAVREAAHKIDRVILGADDER